MSEDYLKKRRCALNPTKEEIRELLYNDLLPASNNEFQDRNKCNADFKLEMPREDLENVNVIEDITKFDLNAGSYFEKYHSTLNDEQLRIFNCITEDISSGRGSLHKLDAPGGSGKSDLENLIPAYSRKEGKVALATVLSGIAATILTLGKTFHRQFGTPIPCHGNSSSSMKLGSRNAQLIIKAALIMVDEVSVMN